MRAREFVTEGRTGTITQDVGRALPGAFKIPALKNQDPIPTISLWCGHCRRQRCCPTCPRWSSAI